MCLPRVLEEARRCVAPPGRPMSWPMPIGVETSGQGKVGPDVAASPSLPRIQRHRAADALGVYHRAPWIDLPFHATGLIGSRPVPLGTRDRPSFHAHTWRIGLDLGAPGCSGSVLDIDIFLRTGETHWI